MATTKLDVIVFPGGFNLPIWAGQEQGFFARHGVEVELHFTGSSMEQLSGLIRGDWDIGMTGVDNVVAYQEGQGEAEIDREPDLFVFMGGDAGSNAPAYADPPAGVDGTSGVKVEVSDPLGGSAAVYLFKKTGDLDPGAGKDYVDYDFNLTNLPAGQSIKDGYGYIHSTNPEDSTVTTAYYKLHSVDRWMEDEMKITAGNADDHLVLDGQWCECHRVAQGGIGFFLLPQAGSIHGNRPGEFLDPGIEVPAIGWEQPGPAQHIPGLRRLDDERPPAENIDLQGHFSMADQKKLIGGLTFPE